MDIRTAKRLSALTNDFYAKQGASFSDTRGHPWPGWARCLPYIDDVVSGGSELKVLDLACGNFRFMDFLEASFSSVSLSFHGVDHCAAMVPKDTKAQFQDLDIMEALFDGELAGRIEAPLVDLCVAFGFLHHVPTQDLRSAALEAMVRNTRPGGLVIVTLWRFAENGSMRAKAEAVHAQAMKELSVTSLDDGDFLLGWMNTPGAYRYCHSFSDIEIDRLVESISGEATVVSRFVADGKQGDLNAYLVLRVR